MGQVERGAVKAPNDELKGLDRTRSAAPAASGPMIQSANAGLHAGDPSSYGGRGYAKGASPVSTPDHRFNIGNSQMPQPPAAVSPGSGAIPVDLTVGTLSVGMARQDSAKK